MTSHKEMVLAHLGKHGGITPQDALFKFGCQRLAARICDLREDGWQIETESQETVGASSTTRYTPISARERRSMKKGGVPGQLV